MDQIWELREREGPKLPPWFLASASRSWAVSLLQGGSRWGVVVAQIWEWLRRTYCCMHLKFEMFVRHKLEIITMETLEISNKSKFSAKS